MNETLPQDPETALDKAIEDHNLCGDAWQGTLTARMNLEQLLRNTADDDPLKPEVEALWRGTADVEQYTREKLKEAKQRVDQLAAVVAAQRAAIARAHNARLRARCRAGILSAPRRSRSSRRAVHVARAAKKTAASATGDPDGEPPRPVTFTRSRALPEGAL